MFLWPGRLGQTERSYQIQLPIASIYHNYNEDDYCILSSLQVKSLTTKLPQLIAAELWGSTGEHYTASHVCPGVCCLSHFGTAQGWCATLHLGLTAHPGTGQHVWRLCHRDQQTRGRRRVSQWLRGASAQPAQPAIPSHPEDSGSLYHDAASRGEGPGSPTTQHGVCQSQPGHCSQGMGITPVSYHSLVQFDLMCLLHISVLCRIL